jgi:cysteine synthase A
MPVISAPEQFYADDLYVDLRSVAGHGLYLKCEGFNFAGSIKLKAAVEMVDAAERDGIVSPGATLVESSSGNMGVALSVVAASRGYRFICVTDPRCTVAARRLIETTGGQVCIVSQPDVEGGFLGARIQYVKEICAANPQYVWLNQYANAANWEAHYKITGPAIANSFPELDVLFVGAGTTGTLMGCARYFRDLGRPVTVVAVDSVGSVTFGGEPGRRLIPGLGSGVPPALLDKSCVDAVVHVREADAIRMCHNLVRRGFLLGGSTGTVVAGALTWLDMHAAGDVTAVAISPDLGERYLDTVYDPGWVRDMYGLSDLRGAAPADLELVPAGAARRRS